MSSDFLTCNYRKLTLV